MQSFVLDYLSPLHLQSTKQGVWYVYVIRWFDGTMTRETHWLSIRIPDMVNEENFGM